MCIRDSLTAHRALRLGVRGGCAAVAAPLNAYFARAPYRCRGSAAHVASSGVLRLQPRLQPDSRLCTRTIHRVPPSRRTFGTALHV
eukprot:1781130-Alexandrium_andersonii.AAC.1